MKNKYLISCIFTISMICFSNVYGQPGESVVLDPNTGDYIITYFGTGAPGDKDNEILRQAIFYPATKIDPIVRSAFKLKNDGEIGYSYRVTNGKKSRQPLISLLFDPVTDIVSAAPLPKRYQDVNPTNILQHIASAVSAIATPERWTGRSTPSRSGGLRIGWSYDDLNSEEDGLAPGKTQAGFGFSSKDIVGISMAQMWGNRPINSYIDEGPSSIEITKLLEPLEQHDYVTRPAAVPAIAIPIPFNAAVLINRIQTHMHTWISMQLLDATFSSQLDRYLTAAADAYRYNQPKAGKEHIQTLRRMLKKEHEDSDRDDDKEDGHHEGKSDDKSKRKQIDRLAARVLDFDLKYVLKRLGDD
jgi:hypothetical protein